MIDTTNNDPVIDKRKVTRYRKSLQPLMPQKICVDEKKVRYGVYPFHSLGAHQIFHDYSSLAKWILKHDSVMIDGYSGVLWEDVYHCLEQAFQSLGVKVHWHFTTDFLKPDHEIEELVNPYLGDDDSLWGTRCKRLLSDFFNEAGLQQLGKEKNARCTILLGVGAALGKWQAPLVYLDVPKNEIQYRMRAGSVGNLGATGTMSPSQMYKRFYFIDWVLHNAHKKDIIDRITVLGDVQWRSSINWAFALVIREGFRDISKTVFRVRPWFEPGAWGGQWMKGKIPELNQSEVNYAWSFELIVPENGLVFESDGYLLELAFDFLMLYNGPSVLGRHADFFGLEFPIRFDFLDTWEGGNLSIQCHPSLNYIREQFGEQITQDETYYILDCQEDAKVYLGFQQDIDPAGFKKSLENSRDNNEIVDVDRFVQSHKAHRHDLFLIPNGTIHSAGKDNLVLEISSTPYIFTFKMYDWLRLDLNGEPRAINIDHAYNNLHFEYQGSYVADQLISKPNLIASGSDWELFHLPTHREHFYDVHRLEFDTEITVSTGESCNVLMLVEGCSLTVKAGDSEKIYHYAETFVIPAAAEKYTLVNNGKGRAKVVKAFIKESIDHLKR